MEDVKELSLGELLNLVEHCREQAMQWNAVYEFAHNEFMEVAELCVRLIHAEDRKGHEKSTKILEDLQQQMSNALCERTKFTRSGFEAEQEIVRRASAQS